MRYTPAREVLEDGTTVYICHWKDVPKALWRDQESAYYIPIKLQGNKVIPYHSPELPKYPIRGGIYYSETYDNSYGAVVHSKYIVQETNEWGEVSL